MARKLNKDLRKRIIDATIAATFKDRIDSLRKKVVLFADQCYEDLIPEQFSAISPSLPPEWFRTTDSIEIIVGERRKDGTPLNYSLENPLRLVAEDRRSNDLGRRSKDLFDLSEKRPFPAHLCERWELSGKFSVGNDVLGTSVKSAWQFLMNEAEKIRNESATMADRLGVLLASCLTVEAFLALSPELKPFVPAEAFKEPKKLPAPVVGTLIQDLMKSGLQLQTVES